MDALRVVLKNPRFFDDPSFDSGRCQCSDENPRYSFFNNQRDVFSSSMRWDLLTIVNKSRFDVQFHKIM